MKKNKVELKKIAYERVADLLENAKRFPRYADYYANTIVHLKMAHKLNFGWDIKKHYCKKCKAYLGANTSKIRIKNKKISIICIRCGKKREIDLKKVQS